MYLIGVVSKAVPLVEIVLLVVVKVVKRSALTTLVAPRNVPDPPMRSGDITVIDLQKESSKSVTEVERAVG